MPEPKPPAPEPPTLSRERTMPAHAPRNPRLEPKNPALEPRAPSLDQRTGALNPEPRRLNRRRDCPSAVELRRTSRAGGRTRKPGSESSIRGGGRAMSELEPGRRHDVRPTPLYLEIAARRKKSIGSLFRQSANPPIRRCAAPPIRRSADPPIRPPSLVAGSVDFLFSRLLKND